VRISDEIRASAQAHQDLGPNYDTAVAEGLVERIGEEIDKRIDARLYGYPQAQSRAQMAPPPIMQPPQVRPPGRVGAWQAILALGSLGLAVGATGAALHPGNGAHTSAAVVALIWIVIGVVNVAAARRH
jgi:hypothetical protein